MTLYEDLGVPEDATADEIKRAYKTSASKTHPDKEGGSTEDFQKIQKAFHVLSDQESKERYDHTGETGNTVSIKDKAINVITSIFMQVMQANSFKKQDYIPVVRAHLNKSIISDEATLAKIKTQNTALSYLAKHTLGSKQLTAKLQHQVNALEKNRHACEENIEMLKVALKCLTECSYDGEAENIPSPYGEVMSWTTA